MADEVLCDAVDRGHLAAPEDLARLLVLGLERSHGVGDLLGVRPRHDNDAVLIGDDDVPRVDNHPAAGNRHVDFAEWPAEVGGRGDDCSREGRELQVADF